MKPPGTLAVAFSWMPLRGVPETMPAGLAQAMTGAAKGYNPKTLGNLCHNIQFAFCDELKAYITGFVRSGTYTANGAAEMIKEIVANIKTDDLEILFRIDSGYFDEAIVATIELLGCKYLIKAKEYPTLASQVTAPSILFVKGVEGREMAELVTKLNTWDKDRRFVVSRVLKPEKERAQLSFLDGDEYEYFFFVTDTELPSEKWSFHTKSVAMLSIPNIPFRENCS